MVDSATKQRLRDRNIRNVNIVAVFATWLQWRNPMQCSVTGRSTGNEIITSGVEGCGERG